MSNLNLAVSYSVVDGFPEGSVVASVVATITGTAGSPISQTVAADAASIVFVGVDADTYSYSVNAVDASGAVLGTPVIGSFVVSAPVTVSLSLPSAVVAS
jgi:hypothetical protein